jgi:hypothetical protein
MMSRHSFILKNFQLLVYSRALESVNSRRSLKKILGSSKKKIIGIRTDFRRAGECEGAVVNAMIECSCDWVVRTRKELMEMVLKFFWSGCMVSPENSRPKKSWTPSDHFSCPALSLLIHLGFIYQLPQRSFALLLSGENFRRAFSLGLLLRPLGVQLEYKHNKRTVKKMSCLRKLIFHPCRIASNTAFLIISSVGIPDTP